jgi:choline dehydrogenase-like flavoprotein
MPAVVSGNTNGAAIMIGPRNTDMIKQDAGSAREFGATGAESTAQLSASGTLIVEEPT